MGYRLLVFMLSLHPDGGWVESVCCGMYLHELDIPPQAIRSPVSIRLLYYYRFTLLLCSYISGTLSDGSITTLQPLAAVPEGSCSLTSTVLGTRS